MYSFHVHQQQLHKHQSQENSIMKQQRRKQKYNEHIKPKLLQHYDTRVNAFIRQIEQAPADPFKIIKHKSENKYPAFKFTSREGKSQRQISSNQLSTTHNKSAIDASIWTSAKYIPASSHQFRQRQIDKQIKNTLQSKIILYKKWKKQKMNLKIKAIIKKGKDQEELLTTTRLSIQRKDSSMKRSDDNRSQINSVQDDSYSIKLSNHENIEIQAREYELKNQFIQKKSHYKRLANLQQKISDIQAKRSLHMLLVKNGISRPRVKTENEEVEIDLLAYELQRDHKHQLK